MKSANDPTVLISPEYRQFIDDLKARVVAARLSAARAVNRDLILLYWDIGRGIVDRQRVLGWGESVVEMVSADLRRAFPGMRGFSSFNLWRMRQLHLEYSSSEFLAQAVPELASSRHAGISTRSPAALEQPVQELATTPALGKNPEILAQAVRELLALIPWGHHVELLKKVKAPAARLYYLRATARFGWSRNVLLNQIKAGAYERAVTEKKTHNFPLALPEYLAGQADEMLKSSYNLEFWRFWRQLPQRGSVTQPRVAATPLPWVAINHCINPDGVASGEGTHYAAIVILRSYSFGIFNERSRALSAGCGNPAGMGRAVCVGVTQPRWGWGACVGGVPKVAALPQPWAMRQNPVGIWDTFTQCAEVVRAVLPERSAP